MSDIMYPQFLCHSLSSMPFWILSSTFPDLGCDFSPSSTLTLYLLSRKMSFFKWVWRHDSMLVINMTLTIYFQMINRYKYFIFVAEMSLWLQLLGRRQREKRNTRIFLYWLCYSFHCYLEQITVSDRDTQLP